MKLSANRRYADPEKTAWRLMQHARAFKPAQGGWIEIEMINHPFLYIDRGSAAERHAGLGFAIEQGWIEMDKSGEYIRFTLAGSDLFA